jgi:hypothetical protein
MMVHYQGIKVAQHSLSLFSTFFHHEISLSYTLQPNKFSHYLTRVSQHTSSLPLLVFTLVLSLDYAPNIILLSLSQLENVQPSFLPSTFDMLFILLSLERLKLLLRSPKHLQTLLTSLSLPRPLLDS